MLGLKRGRNLLHCIVLVNDKERREILEFPLVLLTASFFSDVELRYWVIDARCFESSVDLIFKGRITSEESVLDIRRLKTTSLCCPQTPGTSHSVRRPHIPEHTPQDEGRRRRSENP